MKYAVCQISGKQYKVSEGEEFEVDKIKGENGEKLTNNQVLLIVEDEKVLVGEPLVKGAAVSYEIIEEVKGDKIRVVKFRAKSRYRKVRGHRQKLTKIKILKILKSSK